MKLTNSILRQMVMEQLKKFGKPKSTEDVSSETEEVDADEYAEKLVKRINFMTALKIEEARLNDRLSKIQELKKMNSKKKEKSGKKLCQKVNIQHMFHLLLLRMHFLESFLMQKRGTKQYFMER